MYSLDQSAYLTYYMSYIQYLYTVILLKKLSLTPITVNPNALKNGSWNQLSGNIHDMKHFAESKKLLLEKSSLLDQLNRYFYNIWLQHPKSDRTLDHLLAFKERVCER